METELIKYLSFPSPKKKCMNNISNSLIPELGITDFKKSLDFYTRILGFSIEYQRDEEGFAFLSLGDAQIMIDQIGEGRTWQTGEMKHPLGQGVNFQIRVDSIDEIISSLKRENIQLFLDVEEKWYRKNDRQVGNKQFLVQDPDGYLLRFFEDLGEKPLL